MVSVPRRLNAPQFEALKCQANRGKSTHQSCGVNSGERSQAVPTKVTTMRDEYDFSKGERGKFYRKDVQLQLPIHLETQVQNTLAELANAKGVDLSVFVNELLKKDIELIQMGR